MGCMMCDDVVASPKNMHFDHVNPALKKFNIAHIIKSRYNYTSCSSKPRGYKSGADHEEFQTVYLAFFNELPNLAILCAKCHSTKTFAEEELRFLMRNARNAERVEESEDSSSGSDSDFSNSESSSPKAPKSKPAAASKTWAKGAPAPVPHSNQAVKPATSKPAADKPVAKAAAGQQKPAKGKGQQRSDSDRVQRQRLN
jgi:hypothetical protein